MVIGGTVRLVSSVGRAPDLQAGGRRFESCIRHTFSSLVYFNSVVIGGTVGLVSSVGRAPDLQAGGRWFESCTGRTFASLVYFNGDGVNW